MRRIWPPRPAVSEAEGVLSLRRLCAFAFGRWLATMKEIVGATREVLRALCLLVDARTGASHPRYPITLDRIAEYIGRARSTVCKALDVLEAAGLIVRRRGRAAQQRNGTWLQPATNYALVAPAECWRILSEPSATTAAREPEALPVRRNVDPYASPAAIVLSVRGKLPTRDASNVAAQTTDDLDAWQTLDGVTTGELAAQMVETACVAAAECEEGRRYLAVASIYALSRRAPELAYEAIQGGLMQTRVLSSVKEWAARCLLNAAQVVESPAHAVNILRRFVQSAKAWEDVNARG
jgi:DNA-binding transcriptional ArsR family regulator